MRNGSIDRPRINQDNRRLREVTYVACYQGQAVFQGGRCDDGVKSSHRFAFGLDICAHVRPGACRLNSERQHAVLEPDFELL